MPPKKCKIKELKCSQCEYATHRKAFMDDHMRIHTGDRPYKCNECGKGFTQKSNLTKHMIVHGSGYKTQYKCDRCDFTTRYKQSLKMHQNWHSGVKPYVCDVCGRSFSQSTHRRTHMKEAHNDERKYQCHLCSKCFKRKEHLDKHIAFHKNERNYACDVCGKTFIEEKHVAIHKLIHGGEETKTHKCDLCPYKSRYKQGLQVHYRIHLGVRPYKCDQCPKAFRTSQTLRIHTRMVHQGLMGKIFHCDMCDYRTANKQTLKKHLESIHMGIKKKSDRYPCPYCGNVYLGHSSLHGHKRKKHPQKLKQEMQSRLQERLAMIRSPEGKFHAVAQASTSDAIEDYRFTNPVHTTLRESLVSKLKATRDKDVQEKAKESKKGKNKAKNPKQKSTGKKVNKVKKNSSEKKTKVKQKKPKSPVVSTNVNGQPPTAVQSKSSRGSAKTPKKPVHDLLQERLAKKKELANTSKAKACKKIDFASNFTSVKEKTQHSPQKKNDIGGKTSLNDDHSETTGVSGLDSPSKESYMSNLGLFQKAKPTSSADVVPDSNNKSRDTNVSGRTQLPVIVIQPMNILSSPLARGNLDQQPLGNITLTMQASPKKANRPFPQIKPLNLSMSKKDSKRQPVTKSPKAKNKSKSPVRVPKSKKSAQKPKSTQQDKGSSMIVYEPVDEPSLGPYTKVEENVPGVVDISPMPGTMMETPEIKQETEDYMAVPLNYSMNEFDSLRALASVYLENSNS